MATFAATSSYESDDANHSFSFCIWCRHNNQSGVLLYPNYSQPQAIFTQMVPEEATLAWQMGYGYPGKANRSHSCENGLMSTALDGYRSSMDMDRVGRSIEWAVQYLDFLFSLKQSHIEWEAIYIRGCHLTTPLRKINGTQFF